MQKFPQNSNSIPKLTKYLLIVLFVLIAVLGYFTAYYFYSQYKFVTQNPDAVANVEVDKLVKTVGRLMELPTDEKPVISTVLDKEKLMEQPFFKTVENGDKLLVYPKAMKIILYRPSVDKIIDVGPITVENGSDDAGPPVEIKVAYYNGSLIPGLTNSAEEKLSAKFSNLGTVVKDNASRSDYSGVLVVDLTGKFSVEAKALADELSGTVGPLPEGESNPEADILVILGQ